MESVSRKPYQEFIVNNGHAEIEVYEITHFNNKKYTRAMYVVHLLANSFFAKLMAIIHSFFLNRFFANASDDSLSMIDYFLLTH